MPKKTLIATPDVPFGDWLRASLAESGRFDAQLVHDAATVLQTARALPAALALLDGNLQGQPVSELKALLEAGGVRVLMISDDAESFESAEMISRPFALADLFARLDILTAEKLGAPIWLDDPARVREDLSALLSATSALAGLIVYDGRLWAWAGALENAAAEEAAAALPETASAAQADNKGLARFVRLATEPKDYLLYAVGLQDGLALALLFPPATPLAQAGRQTRALAQALPSRAASVIPAAQTEAPRVPEILPIRAESETDEPYAAEDEEYIEAMQTELAALLASMPPPDPTGSTVEPVEAVVAETAQPDEIPAWLLDAPQAKNQPAARPISDTAPHAAPGKIADSVEANFPDPAASPASTGSAGSMLLADVTYTYLLVTAAPGAVLTGQVGAGLRMWLPQICQAFGWRLENFKVAPETLEWSLRLTPGMPLGQVVRAVRQRTSQKIFQQFPYLGNGQPAQDFWSPRYLVQRGTQPFTAEAVRKFIVETRRAQGYIVSQ